MQVVSQPQQQSAQPASGPAPQFNSHWRMVLEKTAADVLRHQANDTFPLADEIMTLEADAYTSADMFEREKQQIFRRVPLVLAPSCELAKAGDYKTMEIAGIPVLVVRGRDGEARAFLNSCTHRASAVAQGCGTAARFTCPYHGWTFDQTGSLIGIASADDFGAIDKKTLGLKAFPTTERGGLIWAILDPETALDPADLLGGIDGLLDGIGLADWTFVESRILEGANWKLAFDAHLEFYHIPVLHRETFGADRSNRALYYYHGQHLRLISPKPRPGVPTDHDLLAQDNVAEDGGDPEALLMGEWILFPGVSINFFYPGGARGIFLSQVFPGPSVGQSITIQTYLSSSPPDEETRAAISSLCNHLARVVGEEDLPTSFQQQKALASGVMGQVKFGRNEGGLQHFHRWIKTVVEADDATLCRLLGNPG